MKIPRERVVDWSPVVVGAVLRAASLFANRTDANKDVLVDAAVADSLAKGLGFWVPWEDGCVPYADPIGATAAAFGHPADSHGPLWSLLGAPLAALLRSGYAGLQVLSWVCGILTIVAARALFRRFAAGPLGARAGTLAAWGCALSLGLCDYAGNGSLYAGQALGVLLLPLAAGDLSRPRQAAFAGLLLGLLYLLSYQMALLIPVFTAAAVWCLGWRRAVKPILTAGVFCFGAALPWFVRNHAVFGDPLYSTNAVFFQAKVGAVEVDFAASRPTIRVSSSGSAWLDMLGWVPVNSAIVLGLLAVAVPALFWFAPGGLARILRARTGARLSAHLLLGALAALFVTAVVCPQPRTRHFIGMIPILTGAAAVELALGARLGWSLLTAAAASAAMWACNYSQFTVVQRDFAVLLPFAVLPLTRFLLGSGPRLASATAAAALAGLAAFGAMRVHLGLDMEAMERWYGTPPSGVAVAATAEFYDYLDSPWDDPAMRGMRFQLDRAVASLDAAGVQVLYADVLASPRWPRRFLGCRGRAEWRFSAGIVRRFGADGLILPTLYASREEAGAWLADLRAVEVFSNATYTAFRVPPDVK